MGAALPAAESLRGQIALRSGAADFMLLDELRSTRLSSRAQEGTVPFAGLTFRRTPLLYWLCRRPDAPAEQPCYWSAAGQGCKSCCPYSLPSGSSPLSVRATQLRGCCAC